MLNDVKKLDYLVRGMAISQMIGVICEIGLPDELEINELCSIKTIAQKLNVNESVLVRLTRALSSFGFFVVDIDNNIRHNSLSEALRKDSKYSQHWAARLWTSPGVWQAWGDLRHALRTGEESFNHVHKQQFFQYMEDHPDEANTYQHYMSRGYAGRHEAIASTIQLGDAKVIVDVGGGKGSLLEAIIGKHPGISCILYEQPSVIEQVRSTPVARNPQITIQAGSFFESVPEGGDVYILSYVLHDWPDQEALAILKSCRKAMKPSARLIIVDRLISENVSECDAFDLLLDIHMQVIHKGMERTMSQFTSLLNGAGLTKTRVVSRQPTFSLIEAFS